MINNFMPESLKDIIGHKELFKENGLLWKVITQKLPINLIIYGPSGIGKTTILNILVNLLDVDYIDFNPLIDKKNKLVDFIDKFKSKKNKVVIINEIHNMNKDKQDILLNALQDKKIYLFASTNVNPFFSLNNALISRAFLLKLKKISSEDLLLGLKNVVNKLNLKQNYDEVIQMIVTYLTTDIRKAVDTLLLIANLYDDSNNFNLEDITLLIKNNQTFNSVSSDKFHDLKSAFHKSLRGSDPDASLYYLYLLMKSGDYQAIYRRLIACTYEDVGLANPNLTIKVMSAVQACEFLGEAEAFNVLAFITLEVALSPKSNSAFLALNKVRDLVEHGGIYDVPTYLKNGSLKYDSFDKNKIGYKYPHNFKNNWIKQQYLPNEIKNESFYKTNLYSNYEQKIMSYWKKIRNDE